MPSSYLSRVVESTYRIGGLVHSLCTQPNESLRLVLVFIQSDPHICIVCPLSFCLWGGRARESQSCIDTNCVGSHTGLVVGKMDII